MGDHELLQTYAQHGSNDAFAALVRRHLDLVYSAARRQVRSPHLAEEVTQSVFIDLARSARKLKPSQPLAAWLFLVTRRTAIDVLRSETRRHSLLQPLAEVARENATVVSTEIEPLLDEAIASLSEDDRRAVILRFFDNQSLREVGQIFGTSDDAAQKRVSRAVEQLRSYFGKHGVVLGTAAVASQLSAHAATTAPVALVTGISQLTSLAVAATQVSQIIVMTTLKKIALSTALALSVGVAFYEARELSIEEARARSLEERVEALFKEARELRAQQEAAAKRLAIAESELASARAAAAGGDPEIESALEAWLGRVKSLSAWLEKMPDKRIPEMAYLTEDDWLEAAKNAKVETALGARDALSTLRRLALARFNKPLGDALARYRKETKRRLPATPDELVAYFDPPIDPAIMKNYELGKLERTRVIDVDGGEASSVLQNKIVDDIYDCRYGHTGGGSTVMQAVHLSFDAITAAVKEFQRANNGQPPTDPSQLAPYLKRAVDAEYLRLSFRNLKTIYRPE
jgi:RNA polymerase sigma factor (sigma-70 family)